jgi:hypothetical protein
MRTHLLQWFAWSVFLVASVARTASGVVYELDSQDDWYHVLSGTFLQPGDEVVLAEGVYSSASRLSIRCQGTAEAPILIRAAQGANVVVTRPDALQNVINIEGGQYLTLRGIEVTGGDSGVRIGGNTAGDFARFVTIEECHIHDVGAPAVTCNSSPTYEGMVFRRNEIDHTSGVGERLCLFSSVFCWLWRP